MMRPGQRSYIPGIGYIHIISVEPVRLSHLTEHDARLDGFDDLQSLKQELRTMYAERLEEGHTLYRVCFDVCPEDLQRRYSAEAAQRKKVQRKMAERRAARSDA